MINDKQSATQRLENWKARVESLVAEIEGWCAGVGWRSARSEIEREEEAYGHYTVPQLRVSTDTGEGTVVIRPVALGIIGGDGRVDIESWPSLNRFKLVGEENGWQLYTDSNVRWPKPWSKEVCLDLIRELADDRAA